MLSESVLGSCKNFVSHKIGDLAARYFFWRLTVHRLNSCKIISLRFLISDPYCRAGSYYNQRVQQIDLVRPLGKHLRPASCQESMVIIFLCNGIHWG